MRRPAQRHGDRRRFPKFVLGFLLATFLVTSFTAGYSTAAFNSTV